MFYVTMRDEDGTQYLVARKHSFANVFCFDKKEATLFPTMRKARKAVKRAAYIAERKGYKLFRLMAH